MVEQDEGGDGQDVSKLEDVVSFSDYDVYLQFNPFFVLDLRLENRIFVGLVDFKRVPLLRISFFVLPLCICFY